MIKRSSLQLFYDESGVVISYETLIGIGAISGHESFRALGRRSSLATTVGGDDIWEGAAVNFVYPDQTTGERMTLVSTNANDTAGGSGIQAVDVHYLDNSGNHLHEVVPMAGLTPVHTVATNIRFQQYIYSSLITAGSIGTAAAGDITIYRYGDAARIYNVIKTGGNISLNSQRMVPNGKTFHMNFIKANAVDNKPVSVRLRATCDYENNLTQGIFIFNEIFELYNSSEVMPLKVPRKFPSLCIIKGTAVSSTAGGTCSVSYDGWVE